MPKPLYFTICSINYLGYAITLGRSLQSADPDARFVIFLADEGVTAGDHERIGFEVIEARELAIPTFSDMALRYSIMEFNTAIKAACFQHAFDVLGADAAVYLDPDILVLERLDHVEEALADGAELVLTPHSLAPLDDGADPDDIRLMRTGVYNLGFCAFANTPEARAFIRWWADRMAVDCRVALDEGLFVDQKFLDLGPAYIPRTQILRHPGYNVAYWNLLHRPVSREGESWRAGGAPLHFFHFSGVVPDDPSVFSKHQDRFSVSDIGPLRSLLNDYLARLKANGHARWRVRPYAFAHGPDGTPVHDIARAAWRRAHPSPVAEIEFAASDLAALCNEASPDVPQGGAPPVTRFAYEVWALRPDLRDAFDLQSVSGRVGFSEWLRSTGVREHNIPEEYLPQRSSAGAGDVSLFWAEIGRRRALLRPVARLLPRRVVSAARRRAGLPESAAAQTDGQVSPVEGDPESLSGSIAVFGYFRAESGVGEGARRAFRALRTVGRPVSARALPTHGVFEDSVPFEHPVRAGEFRAEAHLFHMNADETLHVSERLADAFAPTRPRIGYWAWELDLFPAAWIPAARRLDEIWTPSTFVRDVVAAKVDCPVHVIAHPTPCPAPSPSGSKQAARRRFALPPERVLALTMLDFNSFASRKNPEAVLAAFQMIASQRPELGLVVKCHGGVRHDRRRFELLARLNAQPGVYVIDRVLNPAEIDALYEAADMLVSLHRCEGFGLTIAEAMARGLPVVATDHSGSRDLIDHMVGFPVPCELIPVPEGAYPFANGARWADPSLDAAADALGRLAADEELRKRLGDAARTRIAEGYSYERIGRAMSERLDALAARRAARRSGAAG